MKKLFEKNHSEQNSEQNVICVLEKEIKGMEERKPNMRKEGKGDPKYEILFKFVQEAKEKGFSNAYSKLSDYEKHAVITRLENRAYEGDLSFDFVESFRKKLYGTHIDDEGVERLNYEKQQELEQVLQDMWFKKKNKK